MQNSGCGIPVAHKDLLTQPIGRQSGQPVGAAALMSWLCRAAVRDYYLATVDHVEAGRAEFYDPVSGWDASS